METSLYGYSGKILWIDLSKNKITSKPLRKETALRYIGGKGLGAKIMYDEVPAGISPFDPSNPIILATGPVNGFVLSGAAKFCAVFKSPLTEAWGESQCGGYFAPQMKYAGYDAIVIVGRAKRPSYILVEDEDVKIMDATHLWGMDALETEEAIKKDQGKRFQVLSIGPAGENLVRFACINHAGGRQLGRCGAGAVMGSKKLKAVAVQGSGTVEAARPEAFEEFRRWLNEEVKEKLKVLRELGTSAIMAATYSTKTLPTRNWTEGTFEGFERINAEAVMRFVKRSKACYGCLVACGKISRIDSGPYAGTEVEGPEYETLFALGSLCGIDYLESIIKANELCDRLGLDTISAGNVIAFSMECYEKGILTDKDTDGVKLEFGNHAAVLAMLEKIAYRQGIGDVLAEGVKKASKIIGKGAEKFAVHVKGLEPPGYDPRGLKGVALAYAVSCRGACHLRHMAHRPNLTGLHPFREGKVDRLSYRGHASVVKELEDFHAVVDSMVLCKFVCLPALGPILWDELATLYSSITGVDVSVGRLVEIGVAINDLVRQFNLREGVTGRDDTLPERFFKEPVDGEVVKKKEFEEMLHEYYKLRGWTEDGKPKKGY